MFILDAQKNRLTVRGRELVTSGSLGAYTVQFLFSADWEGLSRTAVFKNGGRQVSMLLDETNACSIPWEVMEQPGHLQAGVCGRLQGAIVLPTVWASLGTVREGVRPGEGSHPPTPELWRQELDARANRVAYTPKGELGLYSGNRLLSAVPVSGGTGEGGGDYVFGHGFLVNGGVVTVHTAEDFSGDNTLPITAAAVEATVGNISALLETI